MKKTIKQHFVPQFYLRNWTTNKLLWVYDKKNKKIQNKKTDKIMYRKFFYDYPTISNENQKTLFESIKNEEDRRFAESLIDGQFFEDYFASIESQTAKRFKTLERNIYSEYRNMLQNFNPFYLCNTNFADRKMKFNLAHFLSLQYIRTEYMRNTFGSIFEQVYQKITDLHVAHSNNDTLKKLKPKVQLEDDEIKVRHLQSMFGLFGKLEKYLPEFS